MLRYKKYHLQFQFAFLINYKPWQKTTSFLKKFLSHFTCLGFSLFKFFRRFVYICPRERFKLTVVPVKRTYMSARSGNQIRAQCEKKYGVARGVISTFFPIFFTIFCTNVCKKNLKNISPIFAPFLIIFL